VQARSFVVATARRKRDADGTCMRHNRPMRFPSPLRPATLLERRKRFFADVRDDAGRAFTALCANTGRMLGYGSAGTRIWLSARGDARRHAWRWELSDVGGTLVVAHPQHATTLVLEAVAHGRIAELAGYDTVRREVRYGDERSRIDLLFESPGRPPCYVEIKSVTAIDEFGIALFPDAVSTRAARHMRELSRVAAGGARALVVVVVQRGDALALRVGSEIDSAYRDAFARALDAGVEAVAYGARVDLSGVEIVRRMPILR
jgi:sugar fermentation stimulation protein A